MAVEKWIRDGRVAVIVSPGFGAGWSTWAHGGEGGEPEELAFDRGVAQLIDAGDKEGAEAYAEKKWPGVFTGGLGDCVVRWLDVGTKFTIHEYDGSESLRLIEDLSMTA